MPKPSELWGAKVDKNGEPLPEPSSADEEIEPVTLEDGKHVTVETVDDHMCRWPIGDPAYLSFHFCGRKREKKVPYCEEHMEKAHSPGSATKKQKREVAEPNRLKYHL